MPRIKIVSFQNPKIKELLKLKDRPARNKHQLTVVEGLKEIYAAFEAGLHFHSIFVCKELLKKNASDIIQSAERNNIFIYEVPESTFHKISYGDRDDGLIAVCQTPAKELNELRLGRSPLVLVVENVEKPGNLGAILRTADAIGISAVIVCDPKTDLFNPNAIRSSTGSIFRVNVVEAKAPEVFEFLKSHGIQICAATPEASTIYTQVDWNKPSAIVVGAEHSGLSAFWKKQSDCQVKIPLRGGADSLNVSVSAAVILYEAIRQRSS